MVNIEMIIKAKKYENYVDVFIDDIKVKAKKFNEYAFLSLKVEEGIHKICIKRDFEFGSKFWWVYYLFQTLIGLVGSILPEYSKDISDIDFVASFTAVEDRTLTFSLDSDDTFKFDEDTAIIKNNSFENNIIKKRHKFIKWFLITFYALFFISLIILIVFFTR